MWNRKWLKRPKKRPSKTDRRERDGTAHLQRWAVFVWGGYIRYVWGPDIGIFLEGINMAKSVWEIPVQDAGKLGRDLDSALKDLESTREKLIVLREWARHEVAKENAREARSILDKRVPKHLQEEPTHAGAAFRKVVTILGRGR